MTDFLLELRSEEIPARMQDRAREDLARLFTAELDKVGLKAAEIVTYATPRRLALIARGLPLETEAVSEETKGPKLGAPPQAMEGFLRKVGLTQDQLVERDGIYFAVVEKPGRKTAEVLAEAIPAIVRAFPWPKSQRWGAASITTESLRWVRPLQGIVALFGQDVVPCEVDGILSGYQTLGHRFHHPGQITIGGADDYAEKLRACHVIVDQEERRAIIRAGAEKAASDAGLLLVPDEGLVNENGGLTEWPVPMLGRFDPAFLEVPEEVIQLTARVNQKYFVCKSSPSHGEVAARSADGGGAQPEATAETASPLHRASAEDKLANAFICTANIVANDGGAAIVAGNEKVLAARLSDAKFFWEQDIKVPLDSQAKKLSQITFHEKLGTVADKVERVAKLARWLVEEGIVRPESVRVERSRDTMQSNTGLSTSLEANGDVVALADMAERAARLCKADLVTGMVGEFPELQGIMGGYYARGQGESDAVADAVRDHYKPVGQGDDVPTAPVTVAVSLADKLDTIVAFSAIGQMPTGSKDPFALRRATLGALSLILKNDVRCHTYHMSRIVGETLLKQMFIRLSQKGELWEHVSKTDLYQGAFRIEDDTVLFDEIIGPNEVMTVEIFGQYPFDDDVKTAADVSGNLVERNEALRNFFVERLKVQQRDLGIRHDIIDATSGQADDLVRLLARVKALQGFVGTEEGTNLLAGYKRAANILKSSQPQPPVLDTAAGAPMAGKGEQQIPQTGEEDPFAEVDQGLRKVVAENVAQRGHTAGTIPEGAAAADIALLGALDTAEPQAAAAVGQERFEDAMAALASLRAPIDRFFDEVMVNDEDPAKRAFRLGLLARFRDAVHRVADFSKIEG